MRLNIRKAERLHTLTENANNRERQFSHPNLPPDRIVLPENLVRELHGDQADFAPHLHVTGIKIAPTRHNKPPNLLVTLRHSNKIHGVLHRAGNHGHGQFAASRYLNHVGNGLGGLHVLQRHFITKRLRLVRPLDQLRLD